MSDRDQHSGDEASLVSSSSSFSGDSTDSNDYTKHFKMQEFYNFEPLYLDNSKLGQGRHLHVV